MDKKNFLTAQDIADEMGVSKSYAYKILKQLNAEMKELGYLTVAGRVDAKERISDKARGTGMGKGTDAEAEFQTGYDFCQFL